MKKVLGIFCALAMLLSFAFISNVVSEKNPFSAQAQTRSGRVTVKKRKNGIASRTYRGGKYVYRKGKNGVIYVYRKTAQGTVYVGKKAYQGGKYVTKKTVKGTKYTAHKTKRGTKAFISRTKKIVQ
ncbi:hypothetical protein BH24ACI2_BH24ACI2_02920 [soil metagenome]|nr:hypothetical protein [Acidobacteriota bacterium]